MGFFKKIFNPFASDDETEPKPQAETPAEKKEQPESTPTPVISDIGVLTETLRELILEAVAPFAGGDDSFVGLTVWINSEFSRVADAEPFKTSLRAAFDSMKLRSLGSGDIRVLHGEPTAEDAATPLYRKGVLEKGTVWLRLTDHQSVKPKSSKARITIVEGLGSCRQPEYILDAAEKKIYRIGRGAVSRKPGSAYRMNDIIIDDNNPDPNVQQLNNFVSSAHADIIVDDGRFYLKAMPSGCRAMGGSSTKIIRDQEPYELRDTQSTFALQNGDIIELGKSVLLQFSLL